VNGIIDCAGECGGGRTIDNCGVCDGNDATCTVVGFCQYGTVDCFGKCHCPFDTTDTDTCARPALDETIVPVCSLFNDGSFEGLSSTKNSESVTDLGSWDASGTTYIAVSETEDWGSVPTSNGGYYLVMQGETRINQTVHTTHWNFYVLTFDAAARPSYGMDVLYVNVDGTRVYSVVVPDVGQFQSHSIIFQAESSQSNIEFHHMSETSTDTAVYVDSVTMSVTDQILLDGSFEGLSTTDEYEYTDYLGAWSGSGYIIATGDSSWGGLTAPDGFHYMAEQGDGWVSQYIPTEIGSTYLLNFYAAARPGYGTVECMVYIDSEVTHEMDLVDENKGGVVGFERYQLNFYATNSLTKVDFHHRVGKGDSGVTLLLDAISVAATNDNIIDGSFEGLTTTVESEDMRNPGEWKGEVTIARSGNDDWGGIASYAGDYHAILSASQKITETVPTISGSSYEISFFVSCRPDYGMETMYVIINGITVYTLLVEDSASWMEQKLNFIADDEATVVSLYHGPHATQAEGAAVYIDNVKVIETSDIVVDGGFEGISTTTTYEYTEDYMDIWTGDGVIIYTENSDWGGLAAPEGSYYVGRQGEGSIEQTLNTTAGQHYALSFQTTGRPNYGADILEVHLMDVLVYQLQIEDTGAFAKHTINYRATNSQTHIQFNHVLTTNGDLTVFLDEVVATATDDLILDGSFEGLSLTTDSAEVTSDADNIGSWTGEAYIVRSKNSLYNKMAASAGDYFLALFESQSISQTIETTVGTHYTVEFYAAPRPTYGAEALTVRIRDEIVYVVELSDDSSFSKHQLNFYADSSSTSLSFSHDASVDVDIAVLVDGIATSESDNIVIDGSFEGLSITSSYEKVEADSIIGAWSPGTVINHVIVKSENGNYGALVAPEGDYYLCMSGSIAQEFQTEQGSFYILTFYMAQRPGYRMGNLQIYIDGVLEHTIISAIDTDFEKMSYLLTAAGDTVTIQFNHEVTSDSEEFVLVDDFNLVLYDETSIDDDFTAQC
jgi:uncharacterized membrane protein